MDDLDPFLRSQKSGERKREGCFTIFSLIEHLLFLFVLTIVDDLDLDARLLWLCRGKQYLSRTAHDYYRLIHDICHARFDDLELDFESVCKTRSCFILWSQHGNQVVWRYQSWSCIKLVD